MFYIVRFYLYLIDKSTTDKKLNYLLINIFLKYYFERISSYIKVAR